MLQKYIGLYRDGSLSVFNNNSGLKLRIVKKHIQKIFKEKILDIVAECNLKIINYLDL